MVLWGTIGVNVVWELELNRYKANAVSGRAGYIHVMYNSVRSYRFDKSGKESRKAILIK